MQVDVIIPVYKPDKKFIEVLDGLMRQTLLPACIYVVNTEQKYWDELFKNIDVSSKYPMLSVTHIQKKDFDHGGTRRMAAELGSSPIFVMMTQDAVPTDKYLLEKLVAALKTEQESEEKITHTVAIAYARQLAGPNSGILEKISREFNYPKESRIKTKDDMESLGIKICFCSDVCAAYRRDIYETLEGFVPKTLFNEDMIFAHSAIMAGYGIKYEAEALVLHSHNYTNMQQLRRNFDLGVSQTQHPEVFGSLSSESEGMKLVKAGFAQLFNSGKIYLVPHFVLQCGAKYVGYLLGKNYKKLPEKMVLKLTTNPLYFA